MLSGSVRCALLALTLGSCASLASPEPDGSLTLRYGTLNFTETSEWEQISDPAVGGVVVDWPVGLGAWHAEVGVSYFEERASGGANGSFKVNSTEFSAGLRRPFGELWDVLNPYLSVGLAALYTERRLRPPLGTPLENEDWDTGVYVSAGAWGLWTDRTRVGFEVRYVNEQVIDAGDPDMDNVQVMVTLGYGF